MTRKKILFLDVDGVLNNDDFMTASFAKCKSLGIPFDNTSTDAIDMKAVEILKKLLEDTGAFVVLSSTWRTVKHKEPLKIFEDLGFDMTKWLGITPVGHPNVKFSEGPLRGKEIQHWLNLNKEQDATIAILDDISYEMAHLKHRLVQTDFRVGLTKEDAEKVKEMFNS